jgi:hypothetical protein
MQNGCSNIKFLDIIRRLVFIWKAGLFIFQNNVSETAGKTYLVGSNR